MKEKEKLLIFQSKLQYVFNDISLLKTALTHKSYAYETTQHASTKYNERIEFLGDAILEHIISELLYNHVPGLSEGDMSKIRASIVCEASLSMAMKRIQAQDFIYLGKCETSTNGKMKDAILADAFEAVLGAIYIDAGYDIAKDTALRLLKREIELGLKGDILNVDYKTKLQEILQKNGTVKIEYVMVKEEGPEHDKTFYVDLIFNGKKIGEGFGKSKKQAEQQAAKHALEKENN